METKVTTRYNDTYATATEAFIRAYFECSLEEFNSLSDDDKAELYMPCLLELEPYD
jgi:hypothetical protein